MAPKRGNGSGSSSDPILEALHQVVAEGHVVATGVHVVATELRGTNSRLERVEDALTSRLDRVEKVLIETRQEQRAGFAELRGGLDDLRGEVHEGFAELGQKIDSAATRDRHLEHSVRQLGERVAKLEARSPEPR